MSPHGSLFALAVFGVVAYRMMSPAQRGRAVKTLVSWLARLFWHAAPASAAFGQALRERTRWTLATPVPDWRQRPCLRLAAQAAGPVALPETLIEWGASFGPRTTNGEWWRLVTATFVHTGCSRSSPT